MRLSSPKGLAKVIHSLLLASMAVLRPLRKPGLFGTEDDPRYFSEGDSYPWWLEARWPPDIDIHFGKDVETYWDGEYQVVRPLHGEEGEKFLMLVNGKNHNIHIVGAPTQLIDEPRHRPRGRLVRDRHAVSC